MTVRAEPKPRFAVLLSGGGRTMVNLANRIDAGELEAQIALVVASRPCKGVDRARDRGLEARVMPGELSPEAVDDLVRAHAVDWVVLAGYLRRVPITPLIAGRVVNIHPALLPGDGTPGPFGGPGMHGQRVHEAVIDAFKRGEVGESGCTVHLCAEGYDDGPVVLTRACPVLPSDTPETLAARVFELELEAYPDALQLLIDRARTTG
jgi:phosphoribosylglycinamide formyltransferase-1